MADKKKGIDYEELRQNAKTAARRAGKKQNPTYNYTYLYISAFVLVLAIAFSLLFTSSDQPHDLIQVIDHSLITKINTQKLSFTAKANSFFLNWSLADVRLASQVGSSQQAKGLNICKSFYSEKPVSSAFDLRDHFPSCVQEAYEQKNCSSGYAFAVAVAAAERFCIKSSEKNALKLSVQQIVSCSKRNSGCSSGNIDTAWEYIRDSGLVLNEFFPYSSDNMRVSDCSEKPDEKVFRVKDVCAINGEEGIMREIEENGPVVAVLQIFSDFLVYSHGIYEPGEDAVRVQGGQAVEIIGWGEDQNSKYWIVKNSWGSSWGEAGYGLVKRGRTDLGLEDLVVAASPAD